MITGICLFYLIQIGIHYIDIGTLRSQCTVWKQLGDMPKIITTLFWRAYSDRYRFLRPHKLAFIMLIFVKQNI